MATDATTHTHTRTETDSLGSMEIPGHAYWGIHTARALENFPVAKRPISVYPDLVTALAMVKQASARANADIGVLDPAKADHPVNMRKLPDDASEIAPHTSKNAPMLGPAEVRHRKGKVPRRARMPWGEGADKAEQAAKQGACQRHREKTCKAEQKQHQRRFHRPDEDPSQSPQDDFPDRVSHPPLHCRSDG